MKPIVLFLPVLFLSSCAHESAVKIIKPVPRKEWRHLDREDARRVRHPESVRTYYKGRTLDKDRLTMNEAHRVYRVENQSRWDLRPLNSQLDSPGYPTGLFDETVRTVSDDSIVTAERSRLKAMEGKLVARQASIEILIDQLKGAREQQEDNSESYRQLKRDLIQERLQRAELMKELAKLKKEKKLIAE